MQLIVNFFNIKRLSFLGNYLKVLLIPTFLISSIVYYLKILSTSQRGDITSFFTAILSIILFLLSVDIFSRISASFSNSSNLDVSYLKGFIIFFVSLSAYLTFSSSFFAFLGGGDAAERLIMLSISLSNLLITYIWQIKVLFFKINKFSRTIKLGNLRFDRTVGVVFLILIMFNLYFYQSEAYYINVLGQI